MGYFTEAEKFTLKQVLLVAEARRLDYVCLEIERILQPEPARAMTAKIGDLLSPFYSLPGFVAACMSDKPGWEGFIPNQCHTDMRIEWLKRLIADDTDACKLVDDMADSVLEASRKVEKRWSAAGVQDAAD